MKPEAGLQKRTKHARFAVVSSLVLGLAFVAGIALGGCASGGMPSTSSASPTRPTSPQASPATTAAVTTTTVRLSTTAAPPSGQRSTTTVVKVTSTTVRASPTTTTANKAEAPSFTSSIKLIDATLKGQMLASGSWKPGDPVPLSQLALIQVSFWGFDNKTHTGSLVVSSAWAAKLCTVFQKLYDARFPIHHMNLVDAYGGDDERSMAADNTSAYNGRYVNGTSAWSMHAYGLAVDINTVENPWVDGTDVSPAAGQSYADRSLEVSGMIHAGDVVVRAFASIGWKWGGSWNGGKDYQHFSSNGK